MNQNRELRSRFSRTFEIRNSRGIACVVLLALLGSSRHGVLPADSPPEPKLIHGRELNKALDGRHSFAFDQAPLRSALQRLTAVTGISIVLDRRLDPDSLLTVSLAQVGVMEALERVGRPLSAAPSALNGCIYFGPMPSALRLRTIVALRTVELHAEGSDVSPDQQVHLSRHVRLAWNDFARPADVVQSLADRARLRVQGLELVPHDLWAAAEIPDCSLTEGLCLLLTQFELAFEWRSGAREIVILPAPENPLITRTHRLPGAQVAKPLLARLREVLPDRNLEIQARTLAFAGRVEEHELADSILKSDQRPPAPGVMVQNDLRNKRFTLRWKEQPVLRLMEALEQSPEAQLTFEYDAEELSRAGVSLDQRVSFEVTQAPILTLLKAAFTPVGVRCELSGRHVHLHPMQALP